MGERRRKRIKIAEKLTRLIAFGSYPDNCKAAVEFDNKEMWRLMGYENQKNRFVLLLSNELEHGLHQIS